MENHVLLLKIHQITQVLYKSEFRPYIDLRYNPPIPFRGEGEIKLIVLGQDPTVREPIYRNKIKVTLLLDRPGKIRTYLESICVSIGISLEKNIYATNLLKNFFTQPPDQIRKVKPEFIRRVAQYWLPLLIEEIVEFKNVPILTLGEPVLNCLTKTSDPILIRNLWGYEGLAMYGREFHYLPANDNVLDRIVFPFPHVHGIEHKFYRVQMRDYLDYMKKVIHL